VVDVAGAEVADDSSVAQLLIRQYESRFCIAMRLPQDILEPFTFEHDSSALPGQNVIQVACLDLAPEFQARLQFHHSGSLDGRVTKYHVATQSRQGWRFGPGHWRVEHRHAPFGYDEFYVVGRKNSHVELRARRLKAPTTAGTHEKRSSRLAGNAKTRLPPRKPNVSLPERIRDDHARIRVELNGAAIRK